MDYQINQNFFVKIRSQFFFAVQKTSIQISPSLHLTYLYTLQNLSKISHTLNFVRLEVAQILWCLLDVIEKFNMHNIIYHSLRFENSLYSHLLPRWIEESPGCNCAQADQNLWMIWMPPRFVTSCKIKFISKQNKE